MAVALCISASAPLPLWTTTDVFAPGIALGHVVGRMGCLLAGCCFGGRPSVPWAITFTDPAAAANVGTPLGVPLHPTQLYEAGAELLILAFLLLWERRGRAFPGRTFWSYMLLYGVSRFVIEFYRGDSRGMVFDALSTSQFVSRHPGPALDRDARSSRAGGPGSDPACRRATGAQRDRGPHRTSREVEVPTEYDGERARHVSSRPLFRAVRARSCSG